MGFNDTALIVEVLRQLEELLSQFSGRLKLCSNHEKDGQTAQQWEELGCFSDVLAQFPRPRKNSLKLR